VVKQKNGLWPYTADDVNVGLETEAFKKKVVLTRFYNDCSLLARFGKGYIPKPGGVTTLELPT
jgi:hypothetical protein